MEKVILTEQNDKGGSGSSAATASGAAARAALASPSGKVRHSCITELICWLHGVSIKLFFELLLMLPEPVWLG